MSKGKRHADITSLKTFGLSWTLLLLPAFNFLPVGLPTPGIVVLTR